MDRRPHRWSSGGSARGAFDGQSTIHPLCALCKRDLLEKCEKQGKIVWDKLGRIYGVKPWPIEGSDSDEEQNGTRLVSNIIVADHLV